MKVESGTPKWIDETELNWEINWEPNWNPKTYSDGYVGISADGTWGEGRRGLLAMDLGDGTD